jgi:hypothetical protein
MNSAPRISLLLLVAISAFNLGRYSVEFSGSGWAWAAVILGVLVLLTGVSTLIYEFRKSDARRP